MMPWGEVRNLGRTPNPLKAGSTPAPATIALPTLRIVFEYVTDDMPYPEPPEVVAAEV